MKASRNRPMSGYERTVSALGIVLAVVMALGGLTIAGAGVVLAVAMANYGSNK